MRSKIIGGFLSIIVILLLSACSINASVTSGKTTQAEKETVVKDKITEKADVSDAQKKVLILYYSYSETTKGIAERLQKETGGDLFEIETEKNYSDVLVESREERQTGRLPVLKSGLPDTSSYDLILVGSPVWSHSLATPLMSFLAQMDFKGKEVAAFCTNQGEPGEFFKDFKIQAKNAVILKGLNLANVKLSSKEEIDKQIDEWLYGMPVSRSPIAEKGTQIKMTVGEKIITVTLNNSEASQDFIKSLPVTIKMTRWGDREYYGKVEEALPNKGNLQDGFENGDVAYWPQGGSFAIFYNRESNPNISNLLIMGKITSDLKVFDTLGESVEMKIEVNN